MFTILKYGEKINCVPITEVNIINIARPSEAPFMPSLIKSQ